MKLLEKLSKSKPTPSSVKVAHLDDGDYPATLEFETFCQIAADQKACALLIHTREYSQVMQQAHRYFTDRFGENSEAARAVTTARLICPHCRFEFPASYLVILVAPEMLPAAVAGALPGFNAFEETGACPHCGGLQALYLYDARSDGAITLADLEALRVYWRSRALMWWKTQGRDAAICDLCSLPLAQEEGYLSGSRLFCESCCDRLLEPDEALANLRRNPDYFGSGEVRKARLLASRRE